MALLKKVRGSTLMETMVATVLIVVIFMLASLLLETIFSASVSKNHMAITEHLQELEYEYKQELISLPYAEEWQDWEIDIRRERIRGVNYVVLDARDRKTNTNKTTYLIGNE